MTPLQAQMAGASLSLAVSVWSGLLTLQKIWKANTASSVSATIWQRFGPIARSRGMCGAGGLCCRPGGDQPAAVSPRRAKGGA